MAVDPLTSRNKPPEGRRVTPRMKRWAPRSRSGCATCRSRRIKCDETRPACLRCIGTNRECAGYPLDSSPPTALTVSPSAKVCPLGRDPHREEILMFGLLRDEALSRLTGSVATKLWSHDILQAVQSYPAVWHAGLAMAAMHKRYKIQGHSENVIQTRRNYYSFSLVNYNAAIKHLMEIVGRKHLSDRDRETLLVASVLFLGLCLLQEHVSEAIVHAHSGTNMYYQWQMGDPTVEADRQGILSIESLTILMATLECAYIEPAVRPMMAKKWRWKSRPLPDCSPVPFNSLSEAYMEFIPLLNFMVEHGRSADPKRSFATERNSNWSDWIRYRHEYGVWKGKFRKFMLSWDTNDKELDVVLELEMFVRIYDLTFGEITQPVEMHWDTCAPIFEEIVDIGEQIWELQAQNARKHDEEAGAFRLTLSPAEALYFVVASYRNAQLRRRTIALLKKWKRRNGVWDTATLAALSETLVEYEEGAASNDEWCECVLGEFICHGHRSAWTNAVFGENGEVVMRIRSVHDMRSDLPGVTYVLHS